MNESRVSDIMHLLPEFPQMSERAILLMFYYLVGFGKGTLGHK